MSDKSNIEWTDAAIDAATRIYCGGLPLASDPKSKSLEGILAHGKCFAPHCTCWKDGRELTRAALKAAVEHNEFPHPPSVQRSAA